jgi:hypothetical protein
MDTRTASIGQASAEYLEQARINRIESGLATIKQYMPEVYSLIKDKAEVLGSSVYGLVRRGLGGEPGCFYAFEAGHVVGQPRGVVEKDAAELGQFTACFGCAYVCIFGELPAPASAGGASGAH